MSRTILGHAEAIRSGVPRGEVARVPRRAVDATGDPRPPRGTPAVPGSADLAERYRPERPLRAVEGAREAWDRRPALLLRAPAARRVSPHRARPRARHRRGRPRGVGLQAPAPGRFAGARRLRRRPAGALLLPDVRHARAREHGAPAPGRAVVRAQTRHAVAQAPAQASVWRTIFDSTM